MALDFGNLFDRKTESSFIRNLLSGFENVVDKGIDMGAFGPLPMIIKNRQPKPWDDPFLTDAQKLNALGGVDPQTERSTPESLQAMPKIALTAPQSVYNELNAAEQFQQNTEKEVDKTVEVIKSKLNAGENIEDISSDLFEQDINPDIFQRAIQRVQGLDQLTKFNDALDNENLEEARKIISDVKLNTPENAPIKNYLSTMIERMNRYEPNAFVGLPVIGGILGGLTSPTENPIQQMKATPSVINQILDSFVPEAEAYEYDYRKQKTTLPNFVNFREKVLKANTRPLQQTESDTQTQGLNKEKLQRFGTDAQFKETEEFIRLSNESGQIETRRLYEDPFGNKYSMKSNGKLDPLLINTQNQNIRQGSKYVELITNTNKKRDEVLSQAIKKGPLFEDENVRVYEIERTIDPPNEQDLLDIENIKRKNFNLSPLTEAPDWIKDQAKQLSTSVKMKSVVLQDKESGEMEFISADPDLEVQNLLNSDNIMQIYFPEYFEKDLLNVPFQKSTGQSLGSITNKNYNQFGLEHTLNSSAPKEVLDALGIQKIGQFSFKDKLEELRYKSIGLGNKKYNIGGGINDKYLNVEYLDKNQIAKPAQDRFVSRFNLREQAKALPEFVQTVLSPNNPYVVDLGLKNDLPSKERQKQIINMVQNNRDSIVHVRANLSDNLDTYTLDYSENGGITVNKTENDPSRGGSGFVVDKNHIVTAGHVAHILLSNNNASVVTFGGQNLKVLDVYKDPQYDFAILTVEGTKQKPLSLGDSSKVKRRLYNVVSGYPGSEKELQTQSGIVRAPSRDFYSETRPVSSFYNETGNLIQTSNLSYGGQSGGPVFDESGNVIGIVSGHARGRGVILPIDLVKNKLKELK